MMSNTSPTAVVLNKGRPGPWQILPGERLGQPGGGADGVTGIRAWLVRRLPRKNGGMALHVTRPTISQLRALAEASAAHELTYSPVGITAGGTAPPGYRHGHWSRRLGNGRPVFERASDALRDWRMQSRSGLVVAHPGQPAIGAVVAMAAPLPVGYIDVVCRVVSVDDQDDRFGFTYGTLPVHPEQGEESFVIVIAPDGAVTVEITAVSRSRHPLARAFPPIARRLQHIATNRYLDAMQSLVAE